MRSTTREAEMQRMVGERRCVAWLLLTASLLCGTAVAGAADMRADGRLGFRVMVEGEPLEAVFQDFEVEPQWDAARRPRGFRVEVDLRGAESGVVDVDTEMRGAEWFDVQRHPLANFRTVAVDAAADGNYLMHGELVLKGISRSLAIPFKWSIDQTRIRMSGEVALDRRWFGVGPEDVSSVAAEVLVSFELTWSLS